MSLEDWEKDWDNLEDAVYDKVRKNVIAAKNQAEKPIRLDERERIIKLLEAEKKIYSDPQFSTTGGLIENFVLDNAIALIKGETE